MKAALRKLNFETESFVLDFSVAPTFVPVTITANIRHTDVDCSFGPGQSNIMSPEIQFTLEGKPDGVFGEDGVMAVTPWMSAVPYIEIADAKKAGDPLAACFDTNWDMVLESITSAVMMWSCHDNAGARAQALFILGTLRDKLEGGWINSILSPHGKQGIERLFETSEILNKHIHLLEGTIGDYSVWLKRRISSRDDHRIESRWTFVRKVDDLEDKKVVILTTEWDERPKTVEEVIQYSNKRVVPTPIPYPANADFDADTM